MNTTITAHHFLLLDTADDSVYKTTNQRVDAFQALIRQLPTAHQHLLLYVLDMLRFFAVNASVTRMDASNLAAVFSPGLLSHPQHNTPAHYMISQRVIEFLIEYQNLFTMDLLVDSNVDEIKSPVEPDEALVSPNIPRRSSTPSSLPSPANSLPSLGLVHEKSMNRHSLPPTPISPTTTDTRASILPPLPSLPQSSHCQQQDHTRTIDRTIPEHHEKVDISSNNTFKKQYLTSIINSWHQQTDLAIRQLDHWWKRKSWSSPGMFIATANTGLHVLPSRHLQSSVVRLVPDGWYHCLDTCL
jgi:hypothetical protein